MKQKPNSTVAEFAIVGSIISILVGIIAAGGILSLLLTLTLFPLMGTILGAVAGWFIGIFFEGAILSTLAGFGFHVTALWKLGATLGFFCGFLKGAFPGIRKKTKTVEVNVTQTPAAGEPQKAGKGPVIDV